jgi:hypothetical protein
MKQPPRSHRALAPQNPPEWLLAAAKEDTGRGVSDDLLDRAFWLPDHADTDVWVKAFQAVDRDGDIAKLCLELRSDRPLSAATRAHLADLLERYQLKPKVGRRRTPAYDRTALQALLEMAEQDWREQPKPARRSKEAIAQSHGVDHEVFEEHLAGKRKQSRAVRQRSPRP